jgi:predicted nucleic acid-binding protein
MARNLLIDTDVLIDYLTAREEAVAFLESQLLPMFISSITVAELYAGVREGKERVILDDFIVAFEVVPLTTDIAQKGGLYRRDYGKSHGVGLADSIIAATAEVKNITLVTLNQKHFPMITNLLVPYRKP